MKSERADIVTLLEAALEDQSLGIRVYACLAPKSAVLPYITITLEGTERPRTHDQRSTPTKRKSDKRTWTVTAFSQDVEEASDLAELVDNTLDGQTVEGGTKLLLFEDVSDQAEFKSDDSDEIIFAIPTSIISFRRGLD